MVEPVSITLAAVGAVAGVVSALGTIHAYKEVRRKRLQDQNAKYGDESGVTEELRAARELSHSVNRLSLRLGQNFAFEIERDKSFLNDLLYLRKDIRALHAYYDTLKRTSSTESFDDNVFLKWQVKAMQLKGKMQKAFEKFSHRLDKRLGESKTSTIADESREDFQSFSIDREFCPGAIACQHGAELASIATSVDGDSAISNWGFKCRHCNLEVGDCKALRMESDGTTLEMSTLLASSHLMACYTRDLKAFYRCLACHIDQRTVDFATATELERHMETHPDFSFLEPLYSVGKVNAEADIKEFLEHEDSETIVSTPTAYDVEDKVPDMNSSVSSLENEEFYDGEAPSNPHSPSDNETDFETPSIYIPELADPAPRIQEVDSQPINELPGDSVEEKDARDRNSRKRKQAHDSEPPKELE